MKLVSSPNLIDVHTHIHFPVYDNDREEIMNRANAAGVKMICVGTQVSTSKSAIKLAEKYPDDVWATVGFHPNHLSEHWYHDPKEQQDNAPEKFDMDQLRQLAKHPRVVAIGECGLDYYRLENAKRELVNKNKELQKEVFLKQAELAQELNKPLMIHCRPSKGTDDAYNDLLQPLISHFPSLVSRSVIHFYVGSLEITKKLVAAGFYFTFGGVITFARDYDEIIKYIPLDKILLETDAPYVAPQPYRGRRNEPAYIIETAKKLAELKGVSFEDSAETIYKNSLTVLKLPL